MAKHTKPRASPASAVTINALGCCASPTSIWSAATPRTGDSSTTTGR